MTKLDIIIVGAGPAGGAAAITCAQQGLGTLVIERADFPRHKVCGDCLNPDCWPVLEKLGISSSVRSLPHAALQSLRLTSPAGRVITLPMPPHAEIAVPRSAFDATLLAHAVTCGAALWTGSAVYQINRISDQWQITTIEGRVAAAPILLVADGRNSTICRLLGLSPPAHSERAAQQCHVPLSPDFASTVGLEIMHDGYCGIAPIGGDLMNVCVVGAARNLPVLRQRLAERHRLPPNTSWHAIAPLERADISPVPLPGLFLVGDAARVVEPFTGEGIYYALATGRIAALAAHDTVNGQNGAASYQAAHRRLYRHRYWVNRLTRLAVKSPRFAEILLQAGGRFPAVLPWLTRKIVGT